MFRRIVMVVEMDLHLAITRTAECREIVEIIRFVLFDGEEKRLSRRSTIAVTTFAEQPGILPDPGLDTPSRDFTRNIIPLRFKVVGNAKEQMHGLV
jgi:hypothetical protein